VLARADIVFIDLKLCDPERHKKATGLDNSQILGNIRLAAEELGKHAELMLRMPVVPGINDDEENIRQSAEFIASLARPVPLELLAYHEFAKSKYLGLGKEYGAELTGIVPPQKERMEEIADLFRRHGVTIIST
jgi:pyruvate formate lyase activating enzyme